MFKHVIMNLKVGFDYLSDGFRCCRPDGSDLFLISSPLLHIFDQTMSMLPFATRKRMLLPSIMRPERGLSLKLSGSRMSIPCLGTRTTPRQQRLQQGKEQGWVTVVALLLDAKWPRPRRIASG